MPLMARPLWSLAIVCLVSVFASGCKKEIEIQDGRIPSEYLPVAQTYVANYKGAFEGNAATLSLKFDGDRPYLQYRDERGRDLLHPSCGSSFGKLQSLRFKKQKDSVYFSRAVFAFDPGRCSSEVEGRALVLSFKTVKQTTTIDVSMLEKSREDWLCRQRTGDPMRGGGSGEICRWEVKQDYLNGRFERNQ